MQMLSCFMIRLQLWTIKKALPPQLFSDEENEDTEMLIRLIKIRKHLWT